MQQLIHKPHVVTVEWVVQSLRLKRAAPEAAYLHPDFKTLAVANKENIVKKSEKLEQIDNHQEDTQMVQQYLTTDQTEEEEISALMGQPPGLFSGLTFQLVGLEKDSVSVVTDLIVTNGGRVVIKKANYIVNEPVSQFSSMDQEVAYDGATVVNTFWIEDCVDMECLVELEIYHRPIKVRDNRRLAGCVVSFSGIQGRLRELLDPLIGHLGGKPQETFSRKLMEEKNVYRSTHLVCAKADGKKYEKALEWGVPAVDAGWVIACATSSDMPSEKDFPPIVEAAKPQEPAWENTDTMHREHPIESVVIKSSRQNTEATPNNNLARRLPTHFDMSTPQTPLVRLSSLLLLFFNLTSFVLKQECPSAPPTTMPFLRSGFADTPTSHTPFVSRYSSIIDFSKM